MKCIFLNENIKILINISLNFVSMGQNKNIPALVQIMTWHQSGDKPLFEPMVASLLTHIYPSLSLNESKAECDDDNWNAFSTNVLSISVVI